MKKSYLILAAAAIGLTFASCSSDESVAQDPSNDSNVSEIPVGFNTYTDRSVTRAGTEGNIPDNAALQSKGFGVFAYYTNNEAYDQIFTPNFMYNQSVTFSSEWTYTPAKYWPNEYSDANSDENDKISFFAYAPYAASSTTGKPTDDATTGIAGFSRNTATGDPLVKYIASGNIGKQVDLMWGVCGADNSWTSKGGTQGKVGLPWLNVQHPGAWTSSGKQNLTFNFKHALAGLRVTVDTDADVDSKSGADPETGTKVFIRSITFTGMTAKGSLNLNNTTTNRSLWLDFAGINDMESGQSITWYDGRKDGAEGTTIASNEKVNFLNPALVQSNVWTSSSAGVKGAASNLFGKWDGSAMSGAASTDYVYVIPTGEKVTCTIEYDILTKDDALPGFLNDNVTHGSVVKNIITKDITVSSTDMTLTNGYSYLIKLHLGLKSVTFDASVVDWVTGSTGEGELPTNP